DTTPFHATHAHRRGTVHTAGRNLAAGAGESAAAVMVAALFASRRPPPDHPAVPQRTLRRCERCRQPPQDAARGHQPPQDAARGHQPPPDGRVKPPATTRPPCEATSHHPTAV